MSANRESPWPGRVLLLIVGIVLFVTLAQEYLPWFLGDWGRFVSQVILRGVVLFLLWRLIRLRADFRQLQQQAGSTIAPSAPEERIASYDYPDTQTRRQDEPSTRRDPQVGQEPAPSTETRDREAIDPPPPTQQPQSERAAPEPPIMDSVPTPPEHRPTAPPVGVQPEESPTGSIADWMQGAHRSAVQQLRELEAQWLERNRSRSQHPSPDLEEGQAPRQVADIAESLASVLRRKNEDPVSVRNLEQMALRLQALEIPRDNPSAQFRQQVPDPPAPEEWRQSGGGEQDYLERLGEAVRQAKELLAEETDSEEPRRRPTWRSSAEQLLHTLASRRPGEGESDPHGLTEMHERLLRLLNWKEIAVNRGDSINRDLHEVESMRSTTELPPNRVLEVISAGYRDRESGETIKKARVVLSQQKLG